MKKSNKQLSLFSDENIKMALVKLGLPTMVGLIVSALYSVVDMHFVGGLGPSQVAAVSVVFPLSLIIMGVGLLFGAGGSTCVAKFLGEKNYKKANEYACTSVYTSFIVSIILSALMIIFFTPVVKVLGISKTSMVYAQQYGILFIISLAINGFNIAFDTVMAGEGANMYAMIAMLLGAVINIILEPIFIYVLRLGVKGSAIATIIANLFVSALYIFYILSQKGVLRYSFNNFKPSKLLYNSICKIGMPMLIFEIFQNIAVTLTNSLSSPYGDSSLSGINAVTRVTTIVVMAIAGFTKGYQPFVGYNYGAGRMDRVKKSTNICLRITSGFCIIMSAIFIIFSSQIASLFGKDKVLINVASKALIINSVMIIFYGFMFVYACKFLATGNTTAGGIVTFARQSIFFIPLILLLPHFLKLDGIIISQPLADLLSVILVFILKIKDDKRYKETKNIEIIKQ